MRVGHLFIVFLVLVGTSGLTATPSEPRLGASSDASPHHCDLRVLGSFYQKAAVGRLAEGDPILKWAVESNTPNEFYRFAVDELENRIIEIIDNDAPEFRTEKLQALSLDTGLSVQSLQNIVDYYAVAVFEDVRLAGPSREVWQRLEDLNRSIRLTAPEKSSVEARYLSYLASVTQLSVPEMAKLFSTTESQIRSDLSQLRLSIAGEFAHNGLLATAKKLYADGKSIRQIAETLGVGPQALTYVLHYENELNRGVSWSREVDHPSYGPIAEHRLLERMMEMGITGHASIAAELNQVFHRNPTDPEYRTEGAVSAKLDSLGFAHRREVRYPPNISLPKYGAVKRNGHLTKQAQYYLRDHFLDDLNDLSESLGVNRASLVKFIERHDLLVKGVERVKLEKIQEGHANTGTNPGLATGILRPLSPAGVPLPLGNIEKGRVATALGRYALQRTENAQRPTLPPLELISLKPGKPIYEHTLEEIENILKEIIEKQFGGDYLAFSLGSKATARDYLPVGSSEGFRGHTIFIAYAQRLFHKDHPLQSIPRTHKIFETPAYSQTELLARLRKEHGGANQKPPGTLELRKLSVSKKMDDYSLPELDAILSEIVDLKFQGDIEKMSGNKEFSMSHFSPVDSAITITGITVLNRYARRLFEQDHPGMPVPQMDSIFKNPGYSEREVVTRFKKSHGFVKQLPDDSVVLGSILPRKKLSDYSLQELDAVLTEFVNQRLQGNWSQFSTVHLKTHVVGQDPVNALTLKTILNAYGKKLYQRDHSDLPVPGYEALFKIHGYSEAALLSQFKRDHGVVP